MNDIPVFDYVSPALVARNLKVARGTVHRWIRRGRLPALNVAGGHRAEYMIRVADLDEFLGSRRVAAGN